MIEGCEELSQHSVIYCQLDGRNTGNSHWHLAGPVVVGTGFGRLYGQADWGSGLRLRWALLGFLS